MNTPWRRTIQFDIAHRETNTDATRGIIQGYANKWGEVNPTYKEKTRKGAYKATLKGAGRVVPLRMNHRDMIGYQVDAVEDNIGLLITAEVNLRTTAGRDAWELTEQSIEVGRPMGISREFYPVKWVADKDGNIELVEERLIGQSLTPYPSVETATVLPKTLSVRDALTELGVQLTEEQALALARMGIAADVEERTMQRIAQTLDRLIAMYRVK